MKKIILLLAMFTVVFSSMIAFSEDYDYTLTELPEGYDIYGGHNFNDGWIPIYNNTNDNPWSYLSTEGLVKQIHVNASGFDFSEGLAPVMKDNLIGYINTEGELVIPMKFKPQYSRGTVYAGRFHNGVALVNISESEEAEWKTINTKGEFIDAEIDLDTLYSDTAGSSDGTEFVELIIINNIEVNYVHFKNDIALTYVGVKPYIVKRVIKKSEVVEEEIRVFNDVPKDTWYTEDVELASENGLIGGKGNGKFDPMGDLKLAEIITLSCRVYAQHNKEEIPMTTDGEWYKSYVDYAIENNIIDESMFDNYNLPATRYDVARIMSKTLPVENYSTIEGNLSIVIPDVKNNDEAVNKIVYSLYHTGIFGGSGSTRIFNGASNVTRAEAAIVINRLTIPERRVKF